MPDEEGRVGRLEGKEPRPEGEPPDPPVRVREGEDDPRDKGGARTLCPGCLLLRLGHELQHPEDDECDTTKERDLGLVREGAEAEDDPDDDEGLHDAMAGHEPRGGEEGLLVGHPEDRGAHGPRRDGPREAHEEGGEEDLNHASPSPTVTGCTG